MRTVEMILFFILMFLIMWVIDDGLDLYYLKENCDSDKEYIEIPKYAVDELCVEDTCYYDENNYYIGEFNTVWYKVSRDSFCKVLELKYERASPLAKLFYYIFLFFSYLVRFISNVITFVIDFMINTVVFGTYLIYLIRDLIISAVFILIIISFVKELSEA